MIVSPATIDFESRSACNLRDCGTWRYSTDISTEILCLIYRLPHWESGRTALWHPALPTLHLPEHTEESLSELLDWIEAGEPVEAHGVWFEFCLWRNIMEARYGWPAIPMTSWRCSAAKAASHALPRALEDAVEALHLPIQKDMEGSKVMKKMAKPRKSRKAERMAWAKGGITPLKHLWQESVEMHARVIQYCRTDVLAEQALSAALPDLNPLEQQMFQMDLQMNERGFQLDMQAVSTALRLLHRESVLLNQELTLLTGRKIRKATQRTKMLEWFQQVEGIDIPDTRKETLDDTLKHHTHLSPDGRRALEIVRALGRSSTAKYEAMRNWMGRDGRIRGGLLYHGATTGRWTGKGVQPHNFPKGDIKSVEAMEEAWRILKQAQRDVIAQKYGGVTEALSNALRGTLIAAKGRELHVSDYATIEPKVLFWVAGDEDALDCFRQGRDIYCEMASEIYNRPINKGNDPQERQLGKALILGCGYQLGGPKFVSTAEMYRVTIDEDFAQKAVDAYRTKYPLVKQLWWDQEAAAIEAVQDKRLVQCGRVTWFKRGHFLYCKLPSGRLLAYPYPEIHQKMTPWGEPRPSLTFMGVDSYSKKWKRQTTYGGSIVENIVQAISRDIMAEAMLRVDQSDTYLIVLSVHDEIVSEAEIGQGSVAEYEQMMVQCPKWAEGCPIGADGWVGLRYKK